MKKIIHLIVTLSCLVTSTSTLATTGLKEAFNEFRYQTQVEWDQNDVSFFQKATRELEEKVENHLVKGGSTQEVIEEALGLVPNEQLAQDLREVHTLLSTGVVTRETALELMQSAIENQGQQGANWTGIGRFFRDVLYGMWLIVFIIGYAIIEGCTTRTVCDSYGCRRVCR